MYSHSVLSIPGGWKLGAPVREGFGNSLHVCCVLHRLKTKVLLYITYILYAMRFAMDILLHYCQWNQCKKPIIITTYHGLEGQTIGTKSSAASMDGSIMRLSLEYQGTINRGCITMVIVLVTLSWGRCVIQVDGEMVLAILWKTWPIVELYTPNTIADKDGLMQWRMSGMLPPTTFAQGAQAPLREP